MFRFQRKLCAKCDWEQLIRGMPGLDSVLPGEQRLCVVDVELDIALTVVVVCCPALFHETTSRVANQKYLKLCGDETQRLMIDRWWHKNVRYGFHNTPNNLSRLMVYLSYLRTIQLFNRLVFEILIPLNRSH